MNEPETGDLLGRIACAALRRGAARAGKRSALFVKDVHERARDDQQALTRTYLQARRNIARIENEAARAIAEHSSDRERDESLGILAIHHKSNILTANLNLFFIAAGILVGQSKHLGAKAQFHWRWLGI